MLENNSEEILSFARTFRNKTILINCNLSNNLAYPFLSLLKSSLLETALKVQKESINQEKAAALQEQSETLQQEKKFLQNRLEAQEKQYEDQTKLLNEKIQHQEKKYNKRKSAVNEMKLRLQ